MGFARRRLEDGNNALCNLKPVGVEVTDLRTDEDEAHRVRGGDRALKERRVERRSELIGGQKAHAPRGPNAQGKCCQYLSRRALGALVLPRLSEQEIEARGAFGGPVVF